MNQSKLDVLQEIKKIENEKGRCSFKLLEEASTTKGNDLADIVSALFANGYIRIDNGDEDRLHIVERRDIIRLWMNPSGYDALLK